MSDEKPLSSTMVDGVVVHISRAHKREELPDLGKAGKCARADCPDEFESGFGMAGGGFGIYEFCSVCQRIVSKTEIDDV